MEGGIPDENHPFNDSLVDGAYLDEDVRTSETGPANSERHGESGPVNLRQNSMKVRTSLAKKPPSTLQTAASHLNFYEV